MITHPTAGELVAAVSAFLQRLPPSLSARESFLARVAQNALGIVERELALGPAAEAAAKARLGEILGHAGEPQTLAAELCARIRAGELDASTPGLVSALKANVLEQLAIDQPSYRPDTGAG